jgi:SSS family solute:Na+ symporter
LFQYIISVPAIFGASIWLGFVWRRLTRWAVILQMAICLLLYAGLPTAFEAMDAARRHQPWLAQTAARTVSVTSPAKADDVRAGRAASTGQLVSHERLMPPVGIFFERVVRTDPANPSSALEGRGRFHAEIWVMSWFGVDFSDWAKPQLVAARFFFDAIFPFVLLVLFSWMSRPVPDAALDRFFARLHTPVQPTPEADAAEVEASYANPRRFDHDKLFPGRNWEILRPAPSDFAGFFGTWVLVGAIVLMLWAMVTIQ